MHNVEQEEKCNGLQRNIDRQRGKFEDLKKSQTKTNEAQKHKDAYKRIKDVYKSIRDDHVENHVLVSKNLKHMQAMVETSALRRAECIKVIQTNPAE